MSDESVSKLWTDILHLPGFVVVHLQEDNIQKRYFITVVPEHAIGVCPQVNAPAICSRAAVASKASG